MSQARTMTAHFSGRQDTYFAKICSIAREVTAGEVQVACPRDGCEEHIVAATDGAALILRCPSCGVIFRGNHRRILEAF